MEQASRPLAALRLTVVLVKLPAVFELCAERLPRREAGAARALESGAARALDRLDPQMQQADAAEAARLASSGCIYTHNTVPAACGRRSRNVEAFTSAFTAIRIARGGKKHARTQDSLFERAVGEATSCEQRCEQRCG